MKNHHQNLRQNLQKNTPKLCNKYTKNTYLAQINTFIITLNLLQSLYELIEQSRKSIFLEGKANYQESCQTNENLTSNTDKINL